MWSPKQRVNMNDKIKLAIFGDEEFYKSSSHLNLASYFDLVKIVIFVSMKRFDISVIISTYNQPVWLEKVLWSYDFQTFKNFEVVIADDGSNGETRLLIEKLQKKLAFLTVQLSI